MNYQVHARSTGECGRSNSGSYLSDGGLPKGGFSVMIISHKIRRASDNVFIDVLLINISSCPGLVKKKLGKGRMEWPSDS